MNLENILNFQDPLLTLAVIIGIVSLVLIIVLSYYYKKLKDQEVISEIVSSSQDSQRERKNQPGIVESKIQKSSLEQQHLAVSHSQSTKKVLKQEVTVSDQNYEIIIAQINELSNQINSLNNYIKEINSVINNIKKSSETGSLSEETIKKLVSSLEQVHSDIGSLMKSTPVSTTSAISEINNKLDNLLKLLSTLLQQ